ncbi:dihydropteroate synthase [Actinomyces sp. oral taxon 171 str. F0337]|nr:dihydropteroate synthase [Actinomyces sp. oral taxon 171 str. F0337]
MPGFVPRDRTLLMGVLNVTPDSFSDGGRWAAPEAAAAHARELITQGADIIDIGGESTRPGAQRVDVDTEISRVLPVVRALLADGTDGTGTAGSAVISVDTIHAATAEAAIDAGAHIINDVSGGLADPAMHGLIARTGVVYVCQHWRGDPETMDRLTDYPGGVVAGVEAELRERLSELDAAGVDRSQVVLDPGLGFAKTHAQSWELLAATSRLIADLGQPILVGSSRKRFLAQAAEAEATPVQRDAATAATTALAAAAGAWAVRVHEVPANRAAVRTASLWKEHQ